MKNGKEREGEGVHGRARRLLKAFGVCGQLGELVTVEEPGQRCVLGSRVSLQVALRHDAPEIFCLKVLVIGIFQKQTENGVSFFERDFYIILVQRRFAGKKTFDVFAFHIC